MIQPQNTYKRTYASLVAIIPSGQTMSNIVDVGGMTLMRIITDANWLTAAVTFNVFEIPNGTSTVLNNYDGINNSALTVPALPARTSLPFYAHWFASTPYIQIVSNVTQTSTTNVTLVLEPLWQGIHG